MKTTTENRTGSIEKIPRRRLLALIGGSAAAMLVGSCAGRDEEVPVDASGPCPLTPEQEEGPFYVDEGLVRSDVLDGESGVALDLWIKVLTAKTCQPIVNAAVDVWSANAAGKYSDIKREGTGGQKFLRGIQMTDAEGFVKFRTIYPGWYSGRTCHVHLKVHIGSQANGESLTPGNSRIAYTGQLFFPPEINEALRPVYAENKNEFVNNDKDRIYRKQGGQRSLLTLEGSLADGFAGTGIVAVAA